MDRKGLLSQMLRRYVEVDVFGATYRLQSLTEGEKSAVEATIIKEGLTSVDGRKRLLIASLVDKDGVKLLTSEDMVSLDSVDGAITAVLFDTALKHCGFSNDDFEELAKNSETIRAADSRSV